MNLKKGAPGRGGGERGESFSYCGVGHGLKGSFTAWLAGEPYWADEAHEHTDAQPGTKPCLHWLTDGEVPCPRCRSPKPRKCIGWVPLYRETDGQPVIVVVHESASDSLLSLAYPTLVTVGRVDAKASVYVRRAETQVVMKTGVVTRQKPVDIIPTLLGMWRMPELDAWLRRRPEPVPGVIKQRLSVPAPTSAVEAMAVDAEKKAPGTWGALVDQALNDAVSRNGKHARKGEGS